jgi:hypothetical protein
MGWVVLFIMSSVIGLQSSLASARGVSDISAPCRPWKGSPSPAIIGAGLNGVSGRAGDDAWAVGETYYLPYPLIDHWDGAQWTLTSSNGGDTNMTDVVSVTSADAWAVGYSVFVEHWDGSHWTSVRVPLPPAIGPEQLSGIDASTETDVWAVGSYIGSDGIHPWVEHWDGERWSLVPAPDGTPNSTNVFYDVSARSGTDAWAVGYQDTTGGAYFQPLIEHWDGTAWTVATSPPIPDDNSQLLGVSALSANQVWAVGLNSLIEYWNGASWTVQTPAPKPGAFYAVDALTSTEVWAAGEFGVGLDYFPLTERFNGRKWFLVPTDYPGNGATLHAIDAVASDDIWAVGAHYDAQGLKPLILHSKGAC